MISGEASRHIFCVFVRKMLARGTPRLHCAMKIKQYTLHNFTKNAGPNEVHAPRMSRGGQSEIKSLKPFLWRYLYRHQLYRKVCTFHSVWTWPPTVRQISSQSFSPRLDVPRIPESNLMIHFFMHQTLEGRYPVTAINWWCCKKMRAKYPTFDK